MNCDYHDVYKKIGGKVLEKRHKKVVAVSTLHLHHRRRYHRYPPPTAADSRRHRRRPPSAAVIAVGPCHCHCTYCLFFFCFFFKGRLQIGERIKNSKSS